MKAFRNIWNAALRKFELIPEEEYQKNMSAKSGTTISANPSVEDKICNNTKCRLSMYHKDQGIEECLITEDSSTIMGDEYTPASSGGPIGGGWYGGSGPVTTVFKEKCRHEPTPCFKVKGTKISYYGGSEAKVDEYNWDGLVVCLLGQDEPLKEKETVRSTGDWAKVLKPFTTHYLPAENYITIDWPDYGAPPVAPGFWKKLHEMVEKKGIEKVLVFCMGGHGRTGTALSAVLIEVCGFPAKEAVKWVRKEYCKEAVESDSQEAYLKKIAKKAKQAKSKGSTDPAKK